MNIGDVAIRGRVIAAPMAGVTDVCYRAILEEFGAALTYTEMISAKGLLHGNRGTRRLLEVRGCGGVRAVQLFGSEPEVVGEAAAVLAEFEEYRIIDINCGCPAPKIVRNGEGAALMREPGLIGRIVKAAVKGARGKPVTVKIRKGFGMGDNSAVRSAKEAELNGAAAVCVHGRVREQYYAGRADWSVIEEVKKNVGVPVIGNGDVVSPESAGEMMRVTGCDAVMIGRGIWGNPWLIRRAEEFVATGRLTPEPDARERIAVAVRHVGLMTEVMGEYAAVREMRRHLHMYVKGIKGASETRVKINGAETVGEIKTLLFELIREDVV